MFLIQLDFLSYEENGNLYNQSRIIDYSHQNALFTFILDRFWLVKILYTLYSVGYLKDLVSENFHITLDSFLLVKISYILHIIEGLMLNKTQ